MEALSPHLSTGSSPHGVTWKSLPHSLLSAIIVTFPSILVSPPPYASRMPKPRAPRACFGDPCQPRMRLLGCDCPQPSAVNSDPSQEAWGPTGPVTLGGKAMSESHANSTCIVDNWLFTTRPVLTVTHCPAYSHDSGKSRLKLANERVQDRQTAQGFLGTPRAPQLLSCNSHAPTFSLMSFVTALKYLRRACLKPYKNFFLNF